MLFYIAFLHIIVSLKNYVAYKKKDGNLQELAHVIIKLSL
ncbi:hypothetical protein SEEM030_01195 [Salmonella enterica subsp. enterica serovar Montevideo str. SARB30]|nr:hypothetical protein SEEM054_18530 [Salmonella enterica subsp. enterica serovar Montevideo str. NC_MB110209-0054]EHL50941.1 hypothetical protein SEEM030_01195 [Salmonella enterica subsp. enterica serovar Montevideo str. SARB30]EHN19542.1 hypothetical protein SEEM5278_22199 [Salmonella enterica subsp. enterica serovar Montevideo str. CT_02035278]